MKTTSTFIVLFFLALNIFAQDNEIQTQNVQETTTNYKATKKCVKFNAEEKACFAEKSKLSFYESLISENGFNIHLKDSDRLAIRKTREIIEKKRNQTLYTEK
ncbi:hypothetical protein [Aquimarina brevivitae]|uniref:YARHG domain-containing protein n=1 Tax=Aquimarina brevivitae TaxID=323412 RepID=A0A4Q7PET7_9FLAO|nr:hypothetical protein [Aquimarina brevivitae]RZS98815.1 hypothetical protein EV197_0015 [Aquimarina brevivitae]